MKSKSGESIKDKLIQLSKKLGREPMSILRLYAQERFLFRISQSVYSNRFLLKGGLLLYSRYGFTTRPTVDIDMLYLGKEEKWPGIETIKQIAMMRCDDSIVFITAGMAISKKESDLKESPLRFVIPWQFAGIPASGTTILDIGTGDIVVPKPELISFPVLLTDTSVPVLQAYSIETTIAEKFEAMVSFGTINSRMKDFYDIYQILRRERIIGRVLKQAISQTFTARRTITSVSPAIFEDSFATDRDRVRMWREFFKKTDEDEPIDFQEVMNRINAFLSPVYKVLVNGEEFNKLWDCRLLAWLESE